MITKLLGNVSEHNYYLDDRLDGEIILKNTKHIGQYAFYYTKIDKINLEDVITIGGAAFEYTKIREANLQNIFQLMSDVFANCDELSKVIVGNKLKSIGHGCFSFCYNLEELNLPDSVDYIERNAFRSSGLKNFSVPPLVKVLRDGVFYNCKKLESLNLGNVEKILSNAIANTALTNLELPNTIKVLERNSITENKNLSTIIIPATIEEIQPDALSGNFALDEIIFKGTQSEVSKIKGFAVFYKEYSDIIKIEPLTLDDILKNMHNHRKEKSIEIENER